MGGAFRGCALLRAFVAAGAVAAVFATAAVASAEHPAGLPMTLTLPSGWATTTTAPGARYDAAGGAGHLEIRAGGRFPETLPFSIFVKTELASALKAYKAKDPHATVSAGKVTLPSGDAVLMRVSAQGLKLYVYSLLHNGVTYHVSYFAPAASFGAVASTAAASARSIRFTK